MGKKQEEIAHCWTERPLHWMYAHPEDKVSTEGGVERHCDIWCFCAIQILLLTYTHWWPAAADTEKQVSWSQKSVRGQGLTLRKLTHSKLLNRR